MASIAGDCSLCDMPGCFGGCMLDRAVSCITDYEYTAEDSYNEWPYPDESLHQNKPFGHYNDVVKMETEIHNLQGLQMSTAVFQTEQPSTALYSNLTPFCYEYSAMNSATPSMSSYPFLDTHPYYDQSSLFAPSQSCGMYPPHYTLMVPSGAMPSLALPTPTSKVEGMMSQQNQSQQNQNQQIANFTPPPQDPLASSGQRQQAKKRIQAVSCHSNSVCSNCATRDTSLWRRNNDGAIECNACNLYYRKNNRKRPITLKKTTIMKRNRKPRNTDGN